MTAQRFIVSKLAAAALLCAAGAAQAAITSTLLAAQFQAAVPGIVTDTFADLSINSDLGTTTLPRSVAGYGFNVVSTANDATYSSLFVVPVAGAVALSTGFYSDTLTLTNFAKPVRALGANVYATNVLGEVAAGGLTIVARDINNLTLTRTLAGGATSGFVGFISDAPLASITVSMTAPNSSVFATLDNVMLSAVPEASTWAMMLLGGVAVLRGGVRRGSRHTA